MTDDRDSRILETTMANSPSDETRTTLFEQLANLFAVLLGALVGVVVGWAVLYEILASTELHKLQLSKGASITFYVLLMGAIISICGFAGARIGRWMVN